MSLCNSHIKRNNKGNTRNIFIKMFLSNISIYLLYITVIPLGQANERRYCFLLVSVVFLVVFLWCKTAVIDGDFVAALAFGLVEGVVGAGVEAGEGILGMGDGAADAHGDGVFLGAVMDSRGNGVTDSLTKALGVVLGGDVGKV